MMNIYFAGSIRGGRRDAGLYGRFVEMLRSYGRVLTEHVASPGLIPDGEAGLTDTAIHDRDMAWLRLANVVIAEVTVPSLGVGYEIGQAVTMKKPVLCLFRPTKTRRLSAMIAGSPAVSLCEYRTVREAREGIARFLENL